MNDNKKTGFSGKGYYIALILCAAAIGITSYVYYRSDKNLQQTMNQEEKEELVLGTMGTEDVAAIATQPQTQATTPATTQPQTSTTAPTAAKAPLKTAAPVEGDTICGYSMEVLSYNQTTRDWRVHNGVDLAAESGTEVKAAADGVVTDVFEDDNLGTTVVLSHDGGYLTSYSSLSPDAVVKVGDKVTLGQTIGFAGDTALVETTLGSHVHFSVTRRGHVMDPAEFFAMGA